MLRMLGSCVHANSTQREQQEMFMIDPSHASVGGASSTTVRSIPRAARKPRTGQVVRQLPKSLATANYSGSVELLRAIATGVQTVKQRAWPDASSAHMRLAVDGRHRTTCPSTWLYNSKHRSVLGRSRRTLLIGRLHLKGLLPRSSRRPILRDHSFGRFGSMPLR